MHFLIALKCLVLYNNIIKLNIHEKVKVMRYNGNQNHPDLGDDIAVEPIRKPKDINAIAKLTQDNPRDHLLFIMGVNNGLRIGDLVKLKVKDVRGYKSW